MGFSFCQIAAAARSGSLRVTAENLGYLMLATLETASGDSVCKPAGMVLESSGSVTVHSHGEGQAAVVLVQRMLGGLLRFCITENLALEQAAKQADASLGGLRKAVEAALVPVNRGAGRRALIRLHRELAALDPALIVDSAGTGWLAEPPSVRPEARPRQPLQRAELQATPLWGSPVAASPEPEEDETPFQLPGFVTHPAGDMPPSPYLAEHVPLRSDVFELLRADLETVAKQNLRCGS